MNGCINFCKVWNCDARPTCGVNNTYQLQVGRLWSETNLNEWDFCWGSKQEFAGVIMVTSIYLKLTFLLSVVYKYSGMYGLLLWRGSFTHTKKEPLFKLVLRNFSFSLKYRLCLHLLRSQLICPCSLNHMHSLQVRGLKLATRGPLAVHITPTCGLYRIRIRIQL